MLKYIDFQIKLLPLGNPIIYYDGNVNDEDNGDNGCENYGKEEDD